MITTVLAQERVRSVVATLHPNETYTSVATAALSALTRAHSRLSVETGNMEAHLRSCDYVATQNSSAAFSGFFFGKPAVLFARIDFHHIAANVSALGAGHAIAQVQSLSPDYAGYVHWFWQKMAINAGRPEADEQIAGAIRRAGWPM